jgi:drug/metabolite transporter (DMT)-like permease
VRPEASIAWRFLAASLLAFALGRAFGRPLGVPRAAWPMLAVFGCTMFGLGYVLVYHAERHVASGLVALGYAASPLVNLLLARALFGTAPDARSALAGVIGLAGIAIVFGRELAGTYARPDALTGAALTAAAVLASGVGSVLSSRLAERGAGVWAQMAWGMAIGGGCALAAAFAGSGAWFDTRPGYLASLAYLTLFGSIVTFAAYLALLARVGAAVAGYVGVAVPLVALALSAFFEGYAWTAATWLGVALAVLGNVLILSRAPPPAGSRVAPKH